MSETTISGFLQVPEARSFTVWFGAQGYSTIYILHDITKVTLDHEIHNGKSAVDVLLAICKNNYNHYKRILEASEKDMANPKRA